MSCFFRLSVCARALAVFGAGWVGVFCFAEVLARFEEAVIAFGRVCSSSFFDFLFAFAFWMTGSTSDCAWLSENRMSSDRPERPTTLPSSSIETGAISSGSISTESLLSTESVSSSVRGPEWMTRSKWPVLIRYLLSQAWHRTTAPLRTKCDSVVSWHDGHVR